MFFAVRQPLLVKRAADLLDSYIGNTEKNIVASFDEASQTKSILMLDEVDSFLQDRSRAHRHWEIAQVNQFLTSMENYDGLLICTTNLMNSLDPATMRRFDFKVGFDYLTTKQAVDMAINLCSIFDVKLNHPEKQKLRVALGYLKLSHGDFATLIRRYAVLKSKPDPKTLISELKLETGFRNQDPIQTIGFTANV